MERKGEEIKEVGKLMACGEKERRLD